MYSNMCVKIALCLALIVCIDGRVLQYRTLPLSAEGMAVEITVRSKEDPRHPLSILKIDINEKHKKVKVSMAEAPSGVLEDISKGNNNNPTLESRFSVAVGSCPVGYTPQSGFCIPDDY